MKIVDCPNCFVSNTKNDDDFICGSDDSTSSSFIKKFRKFNKIRNIFLGGSDKRVIFYGPEFQKRYNRERKLRVKQKDLIKKENNFSRRGKKKNKLEISFLLRLN